MDKLSVTGVLSEGKVFSAENQKGELFVIRKFTQSNLIRLFNIRSFYNLEFAQRPLIFKYGKDFLVEEFVDGKKISEFDNKINIQILNIICNLSVLNSQTTFLKPYISLVFNKIIKEFEFNELQNNLFKKYFDLILGLSKDAEIVVGLIHKDLIPDNIIDSNKGLILIDWEHVTVGSLVGDTQRYIEKAILYEPRKTDFFLGELFRKKSIEWHSYLFLDLFFYFINKIISVGFGNISMEQFILLLDTKIEKFMKNKIY